MLISASRIMVGCFSWLPGRHGAANWREEVLGHELVGHWKCGTRDTNLSDREIVLKSRRKPHCHVKDWSRHISLAISVKINCRMVLSMIPTSRGFIYKLVTQEYRFQGYFGDFFKPWKNYLLKEKRSPSICVHHPENLRASCNCPCRKPWSSLNSPSSELQLPVHKIIF